MNSKTLQTFLGKTGQICRVTWQRDCKVKKNSPRVEKRVTTTVRAGVNYDNQAIVKEKRETGELPAENAGLPWGNWFIFPYVITHKGENYLRFYPFNGGKIERKFFLDGREVSFAAIEKYLLSSEKQERDGDCFNVRESSIVEIS